MEQNNNEINYRIDPATAPGTYSNMAVISHTQDEFILDFASLLPGFSEPRIHSRIIMSPQNARKVLDALMYNMSLYEKKYGLDSSSAEAGAITVPLKISGTKS